jgi:cellulase/cellobiase CelA1
MTWRFMKPITFIGSVAALFILLGCVLGSIGSVLPWPPSLFVPTWTRSYQLYQQPHAIWLDRYDRVGANLDLLTKVLKAAAKARQTPELVVYSIPLRDLGQSSEGGFATYEDYLADNRENARLIRKFVDETKLHPVIYLEPDSLPLAVQYREDRNNDAESRKIYDERIRVMRTLIALYSKAGAKVYLEAGHSGWFDYADENIRRIAAALNEAGIAQASGLASNVSNRQPVVGLNPDSRTEFHYLKRLLPLLDNPHLDVRVDTSRNGGTTRPRRYYLAADGRLWDDETLQGRLVGRWRQDTGADGNQQITLLPFFGKSKRLQKLIGNEKYVWDDKRSILTAPGWLDPVGDVKLGPPPTDAPPENVKSVIQHYRYIKPPDDCDGALNYPPGASKHDINAETARQQPSTLPQMPW